MLREMEIDELTHHLYRLVNDRRIDYARMITNDLISDPETRAKRVEVVAFCNTFQTWLNSVDIHELEAKVTETNEKTKEAMATAMAAQSGVTMLGNDVSNLAARIAALEESSKTKGPQEAKKKSEIQSAPRTTPSMSALGKKAGRKFTEEQRENNQMLELLQKRKQSQNDTVLTICGFIHRLLVLCICHGYDRLRRPSVSRSWP